MALPLKFPKEVTLTLMLDYHLASYVPLTQKLRRRSVLWLNGDQSFRRYHYWLFGGDCLAVEPQCQARASYCSKEPPMTSELIPPDSERGWPTATGWRQKCGPIRHNSLDQAAIAETVCNSHYLADGLWVTCSQFIVEHINA